MSTGQAATGGSIADRAGLCTGEQALTFEQKRRRTIVNRLPLFTLGWVGMVVLWAAVIWFTSPEVLGAAAALTLGFHLAVMIAATAICRMAPSASRVVSLTLAACVLVSLSSVVFFAAVGKHAEGSAFVLFTLCLMAAVIFAWGWLAELALLAVTVTGIAFAFPQHGLSVPVSEFASAIIMGSVVVLVVAQMSSRALKHAVIRIERERQALIELEASHDAFRDLAENAPDLVYVHDHDGIFTYVNQAFARLVGEPAAALIGRSYRTLITDHPDNPDVSDIIARLEAGHTARAREIEVRAGQERRWVECRVSLLRTAGGQVISIRGIARDVTDRKRMEHALRESEERFRSAFMNAALGAAVLSHDRKLLQANKKFCSMLGRVESELLETTIDDLTHPPDLAASQADIERLLAGGVPSFETETRYRHKLGHLIWCAVSVGMATRPGETPPRLVVQAQDISLRKSVEEALRASEARYLGIIQSQQDLVLRSDLENRLTFVNDAFCQIFRRRRHEVLGHSPLEPVYEEDVPAIVAAMQAVVSPPYRATAEVRVLTPDGMRWLSWEGCAILDDEGRVAEIQAVGRDVTERHEADDRLRLLVANLSSSEEKQRLLAQRQVHVREEERKRLALDLHDGVCQELVGMSIMVEALRSKLAPFLEQETSCDFDLLRHHLGELCEHMRSLAHDLLPMQLADLGLQESLCVLARGATSPQTEVQIRLSQPIARLGEEIEVAVFRVAQEAVFNAMRHAAPSRVVIGLEANDGILRLEVQDDGCGFVRDYGHNSRSLGLAGMEERATTLGGRLEVDSEPGKGTVVRLECPIVSRAPASAA